MRRCLLFFVVFVAALSTTAHSLEVRRQKGVQTYIVFTLLDSNGDYLTGEASGASADSEYLAWSDTTTPGSYVDTYFEITEISTGSYYILLTADEMNHDYISYSISTDNSSGNIILINTTETISNVKKIDAENVTTNISILAPKEGVNIGCEDGITNYVSIVIGSMW